MKKLLIIPDIHGRSNWKDIVENSNYDKVIFLGDYLDPYPGEATKREAIDNFREIIEFKNTNKEKVILLLGNHDVPYYSKDYFIEYLCRYDHQNHKEIEELFKQTDFQFTYLREGNDHLCDVLFSHAGVNQRWFEQIESPEDLESFCKNNIQELAQCSYMRGGMASQGSLIWADVREHLISAEHYNAFQIFGHTYSSTPIISYYIAMLDAGSKAYATLEGNLLKIYINNEYLLYYISYGKRN